MALQRSPELRELMSRFYDAMQTGETSRVLDMMSREEGVLSIGTDPNEWWSDLDTLERVYNAQISEMRDAGVRFQPGDVQCFQEGSVGWCADQPRIMLPDGSEQRMRITVVFHKEGDAWRMVQSHASFGVPNAQSLGSDLTTS